MRFGVLGTLEVKTDDGPLVVRAARVRAMLAVLLLHAPHVVPINRMIAGIWPDEPPRSALDNLRTYVSQCRDVLNSVGERGRLESCPGGYRLLVETEELDALRFLQLAEHGRRAMANSDAHGCRVLLKQASSLWRDRALPELDLGEGARARAVGLEEEHWRVRTELIKAQLMVGDDSGLVPTLRSLIGERPLDESLWELLITALYLSGRVGEALAAFTTVRDLLVRELGIEPGPALRETHRAVLKGTEIVGTVRRGPLLSLISISSLDSQHQLPPAPSHPLAGRHRELHQVQVLAGRLETGSTVA